MNKHAKMPGLRHFVKPKSVVYSLYQSYILVYDMHVYIKAVSGQLTYDTFKLQVTNKTLLWKGGTFFVGESILFRGGEVFLHEWKRDFPPKTENLRSRGGIPPPSTFGSKAVYSPSCPRYKGPQT